MRATWLLFQLVLCLAVKEKAELSFEFETFNISRKVFVQKLDRFLSRVRIGGFHYEPKSGHYANVVTDLRFDTSERNITNRSGILRVRCSQTEKTDPCSFYDVTFKKLSWHKDLAMSVVMDANPKFENTKTKIEANLKVRKDTADVNYFHRSTKIDDLTAKDLPSSSWTICDANALFPNFGAWAGYSSGDCNVGLHVIQERYKWVFSHLEFTFDSGIVLSEGSLEFSYKSAAAAFSGSEPPDEVALDFKINGKKKKGFDVDALTQGEQLLRELLKFRP